MQKRFSTLALQAVRDSCKLQGVDPGFYIFNDKCVDGTRSIKIWRLSGNKDVNVQVVKDLRARGFDASLKTMMAQGYWRRGETIYRVLVKPPVATSK